MNDLIDHLDEFARFELKTYSFHPESSKAIDYLKQNIMDEFLDLNSEDTKYVRRSYFNIEGITDTDFSERLIVLKTGKRVIAGIRHLGANINLPFVSISANFEIASKSEALNIYQEIFRFFEAFSPKYIQIHNAQNIKADLVGSVYMLASCNEVCRVESWDKEKDINFQTIENDNYYQWYKENYELFHQESPNLKDRVTLNTKETMSGSMEEGLLKYIFYKGEKVGLISAQSSKFLGADAIYFNEIFILSEYRRLGLAKSAQRKFIEMFGQKEQLVWGTIDYNNLASFKTAMANARVPVRYEHFFSLIS